jgi:hypothetical protein
MQNGGRMRERIVSGYIPGALDGIEATTRGVHLRLFIVTPEHQGCG